MIINRRDAVASFALFAELVASGQLAAAETQTTPAAPPAVPRPPVFKQDLPNVTMDDWEVTVSYVDYAPGRVRRTTPPRGLCAGLRPPGRRHRQNFWAG